MIKIFEKLNDMRLSYYSYLKLGLYMAMPFLHVELVYEVYKKMINNKIIFYKQELKGLKISEDFDIFNFMSLISSY